MSAPVMVGARRGTRKRISWFGHPPARTSPRWLSRGYELGSGVAEADQQAAGEKAQRRRIQVDTTLGQPPRQVTRTWSRAWWRTGRQRPPPQRRRGRVEIATTTTGGRASITVKNTGTVIPPGEVERLFQPFQQLGNERIRHTDGHGLGLAIVRAIADAHGATLTPRARPEAASTSS